MSTTQAKRKAYARSVVQVHVGTKLFAELHKMGEESGLGLSRLLRVMINQYLTYQSTAGDKFRGDLEESDMRLSAHDEALEALSARLKKLEARDARRRT